MSAGPEVSFAVLVYGSNLGEGQAVFNVVVSEIIRLGEETGSSK